MKFIGLVVASLVIAAKSMNHTRSLIENEHCLYCQVALVDAQFAGEDRPQSDHKYLCVTEPSEDPQGREEQAYELDLPLSFVSINRQFLDSGLGTICIPGAKILSRSVSFDFSLSTTSSIMFVEDRRLQVKKQTKGTRRTLVVRVKSNDGAHPASADRLAGAFFSVGPEKDTFTNSLRTQYQRCSAGQLNFLPATGNNKIVNGVLELNLGSRPTRDVNIFDLQNVMTTAAQNALGVSNLANAYDHIAFCMPPGTRYGNGGSSNWLAFAFVNGAYSYYNSKWCDSLSAIMHEVGHNLGLKHSSYGGNEYGDRTGMMGYSYDIVNEPQMCFNGYKHWQLGWFDSRLVDVDTSNGAHTISLAAFVDYKDAGTSTPVLARLGQVFIQYNMKKAFNSGTRLFGDAVTFTQGTGDARSFNVASLSKEGDTITLPSGTAGAGQPAYKIKLCERNPVGSIDVAVISIFVGSQSPVCRVSNPNPTNSPVKSPTKAPTRTPVRSPTKVPTLTPVKSPTKVPTLTPVRSPTKYPTRAPTKYPTKAPTKYPTKAPTKYPTKAPTKYPTKAPTKSPSASVPSKSPTRARQICDDFSGTFSWRGNQRSCGWLRFRTERQITNICTRQPDARSMCPESCRQCQDECFDNIFVTFTLGGNENRSCRWVARTQNRMEKWCKPQYAAWTNCKETCNSCEWEI